MKPLEAYRKIYADMVVRSAGSSDPRLIAAFAAVERERYLGPPPWSIHGGPFGGSTTTDDARLLYQDVLVTLAADRGINNGQPSLHAQCIAACAPQPGETVVHVGAGTGYYTAILATLVGAGGRVLAYEIEPDLAECASVNLRHLPQVSVIAASATRVVLPGCDVIYVSAGASDLPPSWLDALKVGGRLVLPLTPDGGYGLMLVVKRLGDDRYAAEAIARVAFIACIGARDEATSRALREALEHRSLESVRSLRRHTPPDATVWCAGKGWWLSTADPP